MKNITEIKAVAMDDTSSFRRPIKVCMHFASKTDPRVMRDATALAEAGFIVTIVDVESDRAKPAEEYIRGVHFKHIFMPSYFTPARFKPWFLVKLVTITVRSCVLLLRVQADIGAGPHTGLNKNPALQQQSGS